MKKTSWKPTDEGRAYRMFLVSLGATIVLLFAGIFLGIAIRNASLVHEIILERGRSLFQQIVLTRRWAAQYGGVYVRKGPGIQSNPWLVHPDLEAADGTLLTLRNPALITREISEIAAMQDDYRFRITSLNPLNPGNAPDDFERGALEAFESGALESWKTMDTPAGREFRYMGALKTEASCLSCHAVQGYKEGDIRGGISVGFPVEEVENELKRSSVLIISSATFISLLTLVAVYVFLSKLRRDLGQLRKELEIAATTDSLTGLYNRRFVMERFSREASKSLRTLTALACAIIDADDFKKINDLHGHPAGDQALKAIAAALHGSLRNYDTPARYGGEEFLILFPGLDGAGAKLVCDRLRKTIAVGTATILPGGKPLTVSIGISELFVAARELPVTLPDRHPDFTAVVETMLKQADAALYKAKASGKDCCVVHSTQT